MTIVAIKIVSFIGYSFKSYLLKIVNQELFLQKLSTRCHFSKVINHELFSTSNIATLVGV